MERRIKRGEIWTVSGGGNYTGKPRPAVILQDDEFAATDSVTVCPFTSESAEAPLFRVRVEPGRRNGLTTPSHLMIDKITTVRRSRIGKRTGVLSDAERGEMDRAAIRFLGLAAAP